MYLPKQSLPGQAMTPYTLDSFEPDRSIGYLIKRVHWDAMMLAEPLLEDSGLSVTQFVALAAVVSGRGGTCAVLARELGHDVGATSRIIDALETRGLLARERDATDRRVLNLLVTDEGRSLACDVKARLMKHWNGWLADWSREDVSALIGLLQRLRLTLAEARGDTA